MKSILIKTMKSILIFSLALVALSLSAAELPIPEEQAALAAMAEGLFDNPPEYATLKGEKTLVWSKDGCVIRITLDAEGKAVAFFSNGVPMTNARIARLAALKNLRIIGFDHSGQWYFKEIPMAEFSGAGWEALVDSRVEDVRIGGSHMGKPAELALARLKNLRSLYFNHVPITAEGMAAICRHPKLERFTAGAQHNTIKGLSWYDVLPQTAAIPTLRELGVNELFLSWDKGLSAIAEKGKHLKKIAFGRGSVIFPEDVERLKAALPGVEVITEPYDRALHGSKYYGPRLKGLMSAEEFARLEKLAGPAK
jgi:hypothetical protein